MTGSAKVVLETISGLAIKDIDLVEAAWIEPREKFGETCVAIFKPLFRDNPEYRKMFSFNDVPDEDWLVNEKFLTHSKRSIEGLTSIINAIRNPYELTKALDKLREFHEKLNIRGKEFINLREAIIEGSVTFFNEDQVKIRVFSKAMHILIDKIVQGFSETNLKLNI